MPRSSPAAQALLGLRPGGERRPGPDSAATGSGPRCSRWPACTRPLDAGGQPGHPGRSDPAAGLHHHPAGLRAAGADARREADHGLVPGPAAEPAAPLRPWPLPQRRPRPAARRTVKFNRRRNENHPACAPATHRGRRDRGGGDRGVRAAGPGEWPARGAGPHLPGQQRVGGQRPGGGRRAVHAGRGPAPAADHPVHLVPGGAVRPRVPGRAGSACPACPASCSATTPTSPGPSPTPRTRPRCSTPSRPARPGPASTSGTGRGGGCARCTTRSRSAAPRRSG